MHESWSDLVARSGESTGRDIICFSSNDWRDLPSSKYHIMRHLGQRNRILFVETLGIRTPRLTSRDLSRYGQKLRGILRGLERVESNIYVWSPTALPFHGSRIARSANSRLVALPIRHFVKRLGMRDPIVWSFLPNAIGAIDRLPYQHVVYHCIDDYSSFTDSPLQAFRTMEERMNRRADLTVVSAKALYDRQAPHARAIAYLPHGVNAHDLQRMAASGGPQPELDSLPRPLVGFVGRIGDWIDTDLIASSADAHPSWSFVLIGPSTGDLSPLLSRRNVHWLGRKAHTSVPSYIKNFDIGIMPYRLNEQTASVNPLKMYEYLSLGIPVVSVPLPEVEAYSRLVSVARPEDWPDALRGTLARDSPQAREKRVAAVEGRSWGQIGEVVLTLLDDLGRPSPPRPVAG